MDDFRQLGPKDGAPSVYQRASALSPICEQATPTGRPTACRRRLVAKPGQGLLPVGVTCSRPSCFPPVSSEAGSVIHKLR